jgi:hypothetical protein
VRFLHSGTLILPELPESLAGFAQRLLMKRGVVHVEGEELADDRSAAAASVG